jgi:hypothetical protein
MKIHVTQEHIDRGEPRCIFTCPIAHALQEHFDSAELYVGCGHIHLGGWSCPLPECVEQRRAKFDDYHIMAPFTFVLDLAAEELAELYGSLWARAKAATVEGFIQ